MTITDSTIKILNPRDKRNLTELNNYLAKDSVFVIDEVESQLEELYFIRHPATHPDHINKLEIKDFIISFYPENNKILFGFWIYFPWKNQLVHFLPENMHTELRTARNRNLITTEEQSIFYNSSIGITGLSVGNNAMAALLHNGGARNMRLADLDVLSGSNINRIRTSFSNIGLKKVTIAAREIYEVNPFADLQLYPDGITINNIEEFLLKPTPLNVLIEEMDALYLKIQIRLLARKNRIPVIMATDNGDNIMLDVERFDLNPDYPLLHGDVPENELLKITKDTPKPEAARIISKWVGPENVAIRMQQSLFELGKTLYSWPQLGTAAFLSGCALSYASRKILLNEPLNSGKYIISFDEKLVPDYFKEEQLTIRKKHSALFKKMLHLE